MEKVRIEEFGKTEASGVIESFRWKAYKDDVGCWRVHLIDRHANFNYEEHLIEKIREILYRRTKIDRLNAKLNAECRRRQKDNVIGWKDIADFLGTTVESAMRWEKSKGLPISRKPNKKKVYVKRGKLKKWMKENMI